MSLAIKLRPKTFAEVRGNAATVAALESILSRDRGGVNEEGDIQHAILLTGPSGCGKTTLARLIKDALGCKGRDFTEVDSAYFRGIDSVREIRRNMEYLPMEGECRVWLLDECHMIGKGGNSSSNEAQNALLKALEDAPPHVYFILATTDPEKLLPTIRGRCATFEVRALEEDEMIDFLRDSCTQERKRVHPDVLRQIAGDSLGSCRNALQILDKIIDLPPDKMKEAAAQQAAKDNQVIDLCRLLMDGRSKWLAIAEVIKTLSKDNEPESIRHAVLGYCANALLKGDKPLAYIVIDCFKSPFYNSGKAGLVAACYETLDEVQKTPAPKRNQPAPPVTMGDDVPF